MKKLMIAAAAAAMIGGAQAVVNEVWCDGNWVAGYNQSVTNGLALFEPVQIGKSVITNELIDVPNNPAVTNEYKVNVAEMDQLQIYTFKNKAGKFFCLNNEKNDIQTFYKPSAVSTSLATDGAIYYDGEAWVMLTWNKSNQTAQFYRSWWSNYSAVTKDQYTTAISNYYAGCKGDMIYKGTASVTFECFLDKSAKKVWAVCNDNFNATVNGANTFNTPIVNRKGENTGDVWGVNGTAAVYGQYDEKAGLVKSLKSTDSTLTAKLTTYKDEKARDKAIDAILKKFEKVGGKIEFAN